MTEKFIRFISKNTIFNNSTEIQLPTDLLPDYKTENNQLSIFLLDTILLNRIISHFALMRKGFGKPEKMSYIIFEKPQFDNELLKYGINICHAPNQIDCGDFGVQHLHYNISNLNTKNIHNLLMFFNGLTKVSVSEKSVKSYIETSIVNQNLTFSSNNIKFPKETRQTETYQQGFYEYIKENFPNVKSPTYQ